MSRQYFCKIKNNIYGPMAGSKLKEYAANGQLSPTDEIRLDGSNQWLPASHFKNLQFAQEPQEEVFAVEESGNEGNQGAYEDQTEELTVQIPNPPEFKAVEASATIIENIGSLYTVLAVIGFIGGLGGAINEANEHPDMKSTLVISLIGYCLVSYILIVFLNATANLLRMAVISAKNLDRLTSSNLIIMQTILPTK